MMNMNRVFQINLNKYTTTVYDRFKSYYKHINGITLTLIIRLFNRLIHANSNIHITDIMKPKLNQTNLHYVIENHLA